jgi:hypothetical protein
MADLGETLRTPWPPLAVRPRGPTSRFITFSTKIPNLKIDFVTCNQSQNKFDQREDGYLDSLFFTYRGGVGQGGSTLGSVKK